MLRKDILLLLVPMLAISTVGNGMTVLYPVYLSELGADSSTIGYFFALLNVSLVAGTLAAGWLSDRFQKRWAFMIGFAIAEAAIFYIISLARELTLLTALSILGWFAGGMGIAFTTILAGLHAQEHERGRVFGLLQLAAGIGGLISGLTYGAIADNWGFPTLIAISAALYITIVPAMLTLRKVKVVHTAPPETQTVSKPAGFGGAFTILLTSAILHAVVLNANILGRSIVMSDRGFSSAAITQALAVGSLVALPLPYFLGWLSDRVGRKQLILVIYLVGGASMFVMAYATQAWHFYIAAALYSIMTMINVLGPALVTDIVPRELLGKGISLITATFWAGGILGNPLLGVSIQGFGARTTFLLSMILSLLAMGLFVSIWRQGRRVDVEMADEPQKVKA